MKFGYVLVRVPKDDPVSCEVIGVYSQKTEYLAMAEIANNMFNNEETAIGIIEDPDRDTKIYETDKSYYQIHSTNCYDVNDIC